jgi:hypothetical protein
VRLLKKNKLQSIKFSEDAYVSFMFDFDDPTADEIIQPKYLLGRAVSFINGLSHTITCSNSLHLDQIIVRQSFDLGT